MKLKISALFVLLCCSLSLSASWKDKQIDKDKQKDEKKKEVVLDDAKRQEFEYLFIEAIKQKMIGNADKAISLLASCLEIDPTSAASMYELANVHVSKGDYTSAMLLLEKAIKINGNNDWYKILLVQIYEKNKDFIKASALLKELSEKNPENLNYLYLNAVVLSQAKEYEEAISFYNRLEKRMGINDQLSVAKQQILLKQGKNKKAIDEIQRLIDSNPSEPRYYGLMADMYLALEDKDAALKYYKKVLKVDPENGFVYLSIANLYLGDNEVEKGIEAAKKGFVNKKLELGNKVHFFQILLANKEKYQLKDELFESIMALMLSAHPEEPTMYAFYSDYLYQQKKLEEARSQLRNYLKFQSMEYPMWEKLLLLDNELLDFESMYKESKAAIKFFPQQPFLYLLNAIACLQKEKYDEVFATLNAGEKFTKNNPAMIAQFAMYKAEAFYKTGKTDEAYAAFEKVIELDPANYMAMNNYAYYLSLNNKDLNKAEKLSGLVVEANPSNATYLDTYAWVLFKKKDYRLAKFYMQTALSNGGDKNAVLLEHYGDILYMLDKKQEAIDFWKKAILAGGESEILKKKVEEEKYFENNEE